YGPQEIPKRLSDPFWFQALGCVLGFDWHSSGVTTTTCGALKEGIKGLEKELGLFIAGAFGYHLKEESLFRTGFLPPLKNARILYVGNSSLEGAVRLLLNEELLSKSVSIARTAQVLELSQNPEFENIFIRVMHF
ncbi:MAG: DUF763 domain-containing protein, partial [Candidatus Brocadiales bacterium]|nr:DUF763 domain-containing protein [Candidatus Brocadiales bacterium]